MHILAADGCFGKDGFFYAPSINIDNASLEKLFIHKIFKMLLSKGFITERVVELISSWRHSGFGVYCGKRIYPKDTRSTENLARYIIRASFSQERMKYYPGQAKVTYQSKYGKEVKEFSSLEWMAALVSHIPDRGGQTARYLGYYSNATRGRLKKEENQPEFHIVFLDPVITAAMIDRLTHKSYMVNMNGASYRMKETKEWLNKSKEVEEFLN